MQRPTLANRAQPLPAAYASLPRPRQARQRKQARRASAASRRRRASRLRGHRGSAARTGRKSQYKGPQIQMKRASSPVVSPSQSRQRNTPERAVRHHPLERGDASVPFRPSPFKNRVHRRALHVSLLLCSDRPAQIAMRRTSARRRWRRCPSAVLAAGAGTQVDYRLRKYQIRIRWLAPPAPGLGPRR